MTEQINIYYYNNIFNSTVCWLLICSCHLPVMGGIEEYLLEPVCLATVLVSFGPYVSRYYFVMTIVTLMAVFSMLHVYRMHVNKRYIEHRFVVRRVVGEGQANSLAVGGGKTVLLRNKGIHVPGQSQDDLTRFCHRRTDGLFRMCRDGGGGYAIERERNSLGLSNVVNIGNLTISSRKKRIAKLKGHRFFKTII